MTDPIVPAATKLAAKRGFIRTASQSIATSLAAGITVSGLLAVINGGNIDWLTVIVGAAVFVGTPLINGAQSYFSYLANGIPEDYQTATLAKHSVLTAVEQETDVHHAVEVVARG